jgi:hypothetical protein
MKEKNSPPFFNAGLAECRKNREENHIRTLQIWYPTTATPYMRRTEAHTEGIQP